MKHKFKDSLLVGQAGEERFQKLMPHLTRTNGRVEDFKDNNENTYEVKFETRTTLETPNLALEYSSSEGRPGAIERAVKDKISYISYLYADDRLFTYKPAQLFTFMMDNQQKYKRVSIPNQGYNSIIMLVPRADVAHLEVQLNNLSNSSNLEYHANRSHLSSSNLKQILKDLPAFYNEWVLGNKIEEPENPAFTEGNLVHTLILEPHLIKNYAVYSGMRKAGERWEQFKAENADKQCISIAQMLRAEKLAKAYEQHSVAKELISNGFAEHTLTSKILDTAVKMRADYIVPNKFIVDVKTTSMPTEKELFKETVKQYMYELSAAFYCQIAYDTFGTLHDFYWVVLSKADGGCAVYKASADTLAHGSMLYTSAIVKYKKALSTNLWTNEIVCDTLSEEIEEI